MKQVEMMSESQLEAEVAALTHQLDQMSGPAAGPACKQVHTRLQAVLDRLEQLAGGR